MRPVSEMGTLTSVLLMLTVLIPIALAVAALTNIDWNERGGL